MTSSPDTTPGAVAQPELEARGLTKRFGDVLAVDDVSFTLAAGGSLAIVGESGSGKTTVARMVVGLERPTRGTILSKGVDRSVPARAAAERKRRGREIQIVFQDPYSSLDPRQSAMSGLDEILRLHHAWDPARRRDRSVELLGLVGLDARQGNALPHDLSGGQRPRVAIAPCARRRAARADPGRVRRCARRVDPGADPQSAHGHPRRDERLVRADQPRPGGRASAHRGDRRDAAWHRKKRLPIDKAGNVGKIVIFEKTPA